MKITPAIPLRSSELRTANRQIRANKRLVGFFFFHFPHVTVETRVGYSVDMAASSCEGAWKLLSAAHVSCSLEEQSLLFLELHCPENPAAESHFQIMQREPASHGFFFFF